MGRIQENRKKLNLPRLPPVKHNAPNITTVMAIGLSNNTRIIIKLSHWIIIIAHLISFT